MPTPEQQARDQIDRMLDAAGWAVQNAAGENLSAGRGILSICSVAALSEISHVCMSGGWSGIESHPLLDICFQYPLLPSAAGDHLVL